MDWQTTMNNISEAAAQMYDDTGLANILFIVGQDKEVDFILVLQFF